MHEVIFDVRKKQHSKIMDLIFRKCFYDKIKSYETNGHTMRVCFDNENESSKFTEEMNEIFKAG